MGRRESLRMLEAAFDAGVRHFDVAPMYGFGEAEACLGAFLARHPGEVTVTTKYGIAPQRPSTVKSAVRAAARPVIKAFPALKRKLARPAAASGATAPARRGPFTAQGAKLSLESSLRNLKTTRIDVWLLHEARAEDLASDDLLRVLEDAVTRGDVGTFGVGNGREDIPALYAERPQYCRTLQFEWSVLNQPAPDWPVFRIHHRALTENFAHIRNALAGAPQLRTRWSAETNADLADTGTLAKLMLKASLVMNPASVILFSTRSAAHAQANVATAEDASVTAPARRFYELVQQEGLPASSESEVTP
jgi:aryl-alcohol dehydrogenase-like predicted oxidoreductase